MRYLMGAVAVATCPCHLPILFAVLASTALGAAIGQHTGLAFVASSVLFLISSWTAVRLFSKERRLGRTSRTAG
jgi:mercuric ion transport protein